MERVPTARQSEDSEGLQREIEAALAELKGKLGHEDVAQLLDLSDEEKAEPSGWGRIQESYERAQNRINAVVGMATVGSLASFMYAISQRPDAMRTDPDMIMQAAERMNMAGTIGTSAVCVALAVVVIGHGLNSLNRRIKAGA